MPFKKIAIAALLLACTTAARSLEPTTPADPWIGSYFYFVALDKRCPAADEARATALEQFKRHFIANSRMILGALPQEGTRQALRKLEDIERSGPPAEELTRFDDFFARRTNEEIEVLCSTAPQAIEEAILSENKLLRPN